MKADRIEEFAVHYLEGLFLGVDQLKCDFAKGDKKPFIDGDISYYEPDSSKNDNFLGAIKVQIKGREDKGRRALKKSITFKLKRSQLRGFRELDGVTLFVVIIRSDETIAYFRHLHIFEIDRIISEMGGGQKSKHIELQRFPTDPDGQIRQIKLAIQLFRQQDIVVTDELMGRAEGISLTAAVDPDLTMPSRFGVGAENAAVIKLRYSDGNEFPVPVTLEIWPEDYVFQEVDFKLRSGNVEISDARIRKMKEGGMEIAVTPSLVLRFDEEGKTGQIKLATGDYLGDALRDLEFLDAWMQDEAIYVNGDPWKIRVEKLSSESPFYHNLRAFREICGLCQNIGVDPNYIEVANLAPQVLQALSSVIGLFSGEGGFENTGEVPRWVTVSIGSWQLRFLLHESTNGEIELLSLTDTSKYQLWWAPIGELHKGFRVSPFDLIDEEVMAVTLNLKLESAIDSYERLVDDEHRSTRGNAFLLKLIAAADLQPERRKEFLEAAVQVHQWLQQFDDLFEVNLINGWQIKARLEGLDDLDHDDIRGFRDTLDLSEESNNLYRVGAEILLGQDEEARYWLRKCDEKSIEQFESFPLYSILEKPELLIGYMEAGKRPDQWGEFLARTMLEDRMQ